MRDQPELPIDRAVWWTEYVLRHGRSQRLLPTSALMPWRQWLMDDVLVFLMIGVLVAAMLAAVVMYYAMVLFKFVNSGKVKQA